MHYLLINNIVRMTLYNFIKIFKICFLTHRITFLINNIKIKSIKK